ncbi:PREDICTED: uncharacterized protein LOC106751638 [Dinoponera quadriceps]|uniref:Uncharacterized protein LOC106751638 n=1 Tax=Dinoponera quadriceps TaxID=609295 RepID=A0A6P3YCD6_DINQU|nr:PREDICTED: uncharacterized protein LOC106751638 [Dinoponera quadriceps]
MGKTRGKFLNKDEVPKPKRRRRRKDLDDMHSRISKIKRKSKLLRADYYNVERHIRTFHEPHCYTDVSDAKKDKVEKNCNENWHSKPILSKIHNKYIKPVYAGIFRNGTKSKTIKKGKYENVVSKARLAGDVLKLFDGETETIHALRNTMEDKSTNQLFDKESVENNSEESLHIPEKSPVLGRKQSKSRKEHLEDTSMQNKEMEILFEPIDIPEVVIICNSETEKMMEEKEKAEEKREITYLEYNKNTLRNSEKRDFLSKLCQKVCDELKNVLIKAEDPLLVARRKLKDICDCPEVKPPKTAEKSSNSRSPELFVLSEHQTYVHSSDSQPSIIQFLKNRKAISYPSKSGRYNGENFTDFSIARITSADFHPWRDKRHFNASISQSDNLKLPPKKLFSLRSQEETSTQLDDGEVITIYDSDEPNDTSEIYPKAIDRPRSSNEEKFCEKDFVNMFRNLPTPSTVNRRFSRRLKVPEFRTESMKVETKSGIFEKPSTDLYIDDSKNREENEIVRFRDTACLQNPLDMLTEAATMIENQPPPRTVNVFMDTYVPIHSSCYNSSSYQPSPFFSLHDKNFPSNFNVEPAKVKYRIRKVSRREDEHTCLNRSDCLHECNISQACQNHAEAARATMLTTGCLCVPTCNGDINPQKSVGHLGVIPLVVGHVPYTCPQQLEDRRQVVHLQNFSQPVKYYALDVNGVNARKMPVYASDGVCECRDHRRHHRIIASYDKRE